FGGVLFSARFLAKNASLLVAVVFAHLRDDRKHVVLEKSSPDRESALPSQRAYRRLDAFRRVYRFDRTHSGAFSVAPGDGEWPMDGMVAGHDQRNRLAHVLGGHCLRAAGFGDAFQIAFHPDEARGGENLYADAVF